MNIIVQLPLEVNIFLDHAPFPSHHCFRKKAWMGHVGSPDFLNLLKKGGTAR